MTTYSKRKIDFSFIFIKLWFARKSNLVRSYYNHFIKHKNDEYKVTVFLLTYNQSDTLAKAIDSVLSQRTNFKYKILVVDDCSTDGAQDLIRDYKTNHPDIIFPILSKKNLGCSLNAFYAAPLINTEYMITLEGDDYWIDDNKLQTQFDILNNNLDCVYTSHPVIVRYPNSNQGDTQLHRNYKAGKYLNTPLYTHTTAKFFRNIFDHKKEKNIFLLSDGANCFNSLFFGKWYYIQASMSVYNYTENGIYSGLISEAKKENGEGLNAALYLLLGKKFINADWIDVKFLERFLLNEKHHKPYTKSTLKKIQKLYKKLKKRREEKVIPH